MKDNPLDQKLYWRLAIPISAAFTMALLLLTFSPTQNSAAMDPPPVMGIPEVVQNGEEITIGLASSITSIPELGWRQKNAVQLAVDQINAAGGVSISGVTHTLKLASANSGCNTTDGVNAAHSLLDAGAVAVIGHTCSPTVIAVQGIYADAGVAMVSPSASLPEVTEGGYTTTFRVISRNDSPISTIATILNKQMEAEKVAIVEIAGFWGNSYTPIFSDTFTSLGGEITSFRTVASSDEFAAALIEIQTEDPDAIYYTDSNPYHAAQLSILSHGIGMHDVAIAWTTFSGDRGLLTEYVTQAGAAADGDLAAMFYNSPERMPGYDQLESDYIAAGFPNYGDKPDMTGAFAYDAARILVQAIESAGGSDPGAIRDALAGMQYHSGVVGEYFGFNSIGDVIPQWLSIEHYKDSKWNKITTVGLVMDGPTVDDKGFNWISNQGLLNATTTLSITTKTYTSTGSTDYLPNLTLCAQEGNALCIAVGQAMAADTLAAANNYPDTSFAILDSFYSSNPANLRGVIFAEDEAGYLAGILAGLMSETETVGAVGGKKTPSVQRYLDRYEHAAQCVHPDGTTIISYTNTFDDPALGAATAQTQIAAGADVVFGVGGETGNGATLTTTQSGAWGIGVDTDQFLTLFDSGEVAGADRLLSSAMKNLDNAVFLTALDWFNGNFSGGTVRLGLAVDGVGLAPFHQAGSDVPNSVSLQIQKVKSGIISGEINIYGPCSNLFDIFLPMLPKYE